MPRILPVFAFALLAVASISTSLLSTVSARQHGSSSELQNQQRIRSLERQVEELTKRVELDLSRDERTSENLAAAGECPFAGRHHKGAKRPANHPHPQPSWEEEQEEEEQEEEEEAEFDDQDEEEEEHSSADADEAEAVGAKKPKAAAKKSNPKPAKGKAKAKSASAKTTKAPKRVSPQSSWFPSYKPSWSDLNVRDLYTYEDGTAAEKAAAIWSKVAADQTGGKFPDVVHLVRLFTENMDPTMSMNTVGEVMPLQPTSRQKLIHSVGVHAMGKLKWTMKLPYTGLFQSGAEHVLIRLSSAKDPANTAVTPGVSLKVFRNGFPSANSFFLHSFTGTYWSFFEEVLQNHVSTSTPDLATKTLVAKFSSASDYVFYTGLSDWARADESSGMMAYPDGDKKLIQFPFQMMLVPNATLHHDFHSLKPAHYPYTRQFDNILPGSNLYTVYIQDEPKSKPYPAGTLDLNDDETGKLIPSTFGDETLFFKHQRFEEDLFFRPEWRTTCPDARACDDIYNFTSITSGDEAN